MGGEPVFICKSEALYFTVRRKRFSNSLKFFSVMVCSPFPLEMDCHYEAFIITEERENSIKEKSSLKGAFVSLKGIELRQIFRCLPASRQKDDISSPGVGGAFELAHHLLGLSEERSNQIGADALAVIGEAHVEFGVVGIN